MTPRKLTSRLLFCLACFFPPLGKSFAQKAVNVNLFTGAAQISIPIGVLSAGDASFPISFNYYGGGIKVDEYGERYGLGWSFSAEAGISREVRGFPDDVSLNDGGNYFIGWMRSGNAATSVNNFTISNDNNTSTCSDEVTDYSYMNSNIPANRDAEPDIFTVDVPGLYFQFVFDKDQQIKVIPYRDVKVEYTTDGTTGAITSFSVTNDKGIKYVFSDRYWTYQHVDENVSPAAFKRNYDFYHHANTWVEYTSKWYITSITDIKGNYLSFVYELTEGDMPHFGSENIRLVSYNGSAYVTQSVYTMQKAWQVPRLKKINVFEGGVGSTTDNGLDFAFVTVKPTASLYDMKFLKTGTRVWVDVLGPFNKTNDPTKAGRFFLNSIKISSTSNCSVYDNTYKFTYYDVDLVNKTSYCTGVDSITNAQDYWGYYNGATSNTSLIPPVWVYPYNGSVEKYKIVQIPSYGGTDEVALTGANRSISTTYAKSGSLKRVIYPNGGVTELEYDNNEYYDADVAGAVLGGGIRVRKITDNDGLNTNEVTYYDYNDPSTSVTTGKATSTPDFTITFPNSTTYSTTSDRVKNCTYRTLYDYSDERKQVIYGKVTVRKTNGGKSIYEFNTSGTRGSASTGDWAESNVNVTRQYTSAPGTCVAIKPDFLTNGKNIYPFPANPNFDFERGLLNKISHYNESGDLIAEESYTYGYSHSSTTKIAALKYDDVGTSGTVRGYSKYNILAVQDNLIATRTTKKYNASSPTSGVYTSETETFTYPTGSIDYRLPITIQKQNSDGLTSKTYMRYAKDYTTTGTGDDAEKAIHQLKNLHYNALVESYQSVAGSPEKYVSGSIIKYKRSDFGDFMTGVPLPIETYSFAEPGGSSSFSSSTISSGNFTMDSKYYKVSGITHFNDDGGAGSVLGNSRRTSSVLYSFPLNLKVAEVANAQQDQVLYTSFDYMSPSSAMTYTPNTESGRHSTYGQTFNTGTSIYGNIEKATTNKNIVFSCWLKTPDAGGTGGSDIVNGNLTISLTGTSFSANYTIAYSTTNIWKYYQLIIPKPSPQTLTVSVSTDANVSIDDILVYPDNAIVKTNSFTRLTAIKRGVEVGYGVHLTAETGMNGTTRYYQYANGLAPYIVRDVDENIVQINTMRSINQSNEFSIININVQKPLQVNTSINFDAFVVVPCDATVTYTWDFGDGSSTLVGTASAVSHTYASAGTYTVSCTISASGYTSSSANTTIIIPGAPTPNICEAGVVSYTASTSTCLLDFCSIWPTPTCTATKFSVESLATGSLGDVTNYLWEKAPYGTSSWSTYASGAATSNITVSFSTSIPVTTSYKVRCTVTLANGQTATSAEYNVMSY